MLPVSRIIPHLCGLPSSRRYSRALLMFRFFVDDSGKEPDSSPAFILAGWMARVDDWEHLSDAWEISISANNPKPLGYNKGYRYFSNNEATGQTGCFAGFTPREAALKTANLAHLIVGMNPRIAGFTVTVPHEEHQAIVKNRAITKRGGDVRLEQKLPFYIAFTHHGAHSSRAALSRRF